MCIFITLFLLIVLIKHSCYKILIKVVFKLQHARVAELWLYNVSVCLSVCVCIYISTSGSAAVTGPRQAQIIGSRLVNIAAFSTDDNTPLSDTHTHTHSMVHHTGPQLMPISVTNNHSDNIPRLPKK